MCSIGNTKQSSNINQTVKIKYFVVGARTPKTDEEQHISAHIYNRFAHADGRFLSVNA